jgi:hypothetical protein
LPRAAIPVNTREKFALAYLILFQENQAIIPLSTISSRRVAMQSLNSKAIGLVRSGSERGFAVTGSSLNGEIAREQALQTNAAARQTKASQTNASSSASFKKQNALSLSLSLLLRSKLIKSFAILFASLLLVGCDVSLSSGNEIYHQVSFYDANLDLQEIKAVKRGTITPSDLLAGVWYKANESLPTATHNLTRDIRFYAVPSVQEITNQAGLNAVRSALYGKYILLNDIELAVVAGEDESDFNQTYGWSPIGDDYSNSFTGIFNGANHKITNLWIDRPSTDYIGLFGFTDGAIIKNLGVEITSGKAVKGLRYVGGIAGFDYGSTILNSYATGDINGTSNLIGGIAGVVYSSTISNSYATGDISGTIHIGGIAGGVSSSTISNSYATGDINATNSVGGGIAGGVSGSTILNSYAMGDINATGDYIGGIVGYVENGSTIQNNAAINPSVTGSSSVNRVVGYIYGSNTVSNNFALDAMTINGFVHSSPDNNQSGVSKTDTQLKTQTTYWTI